MTMKDTQWTSMVGKDASSTKGTCYRLDGQTELVAYVYHQMWQM